MTTPRDKAGADALWTTTEGAGPLIAVAIHDGHALRPETAELMALPEEVRLREEDPFTGAWTAVAPTRIVAHRSRFEVDLNRPRARAVYRKPADAWGLGVWRRPPSSELVQRSLAQYDAFYAEARRVLDELERREGRFVVLDLHTYNHRRAGADAPFDPQSGNPDINIGTGTMYRPRWAAVVDRVIAELQQCEDLGRRLDVRENIKFQGGAFTRWVHETYPETGCSIAVEFKKFFMDEWTGELNAPLHRGVLRALERVAAAVCEELAGLGAPPAEPVDYGDLAAGLWRCGACGEEVLARELMKRTARPPFRCARCDAQLTYHDASASIDDERDDARQTDETAKLH